MFSFLSRPAVFAAGLLVLSAVLLVGCDSSDPGPDDDQISSPDTYTFMRNGASSVAYPGQTDRLNMVGEMKAYLGQGDAGEELSAEVLRAMFTNEGGDGGGQFSFTSDRALANKTFAPDLDEGGFLDDLFERIAEASANGASGVEAESGTAGLIARADGDPILVDENGREFVQIVEKGLMGAVFYNQIYNVYLTDDRIGPGVENEELEEGANYTPMEHHWDEAFGYLAAPTDFDSDWSEDEDGDLRFWANYSDTVDDQLGTNDAVMNAYIAGRTAIVNGDDAEKNAQRDVLYDRLEVVAAATTIHYINDTLEALSDGEQGEAFHLLSEAWAFANALRYSPRRTLSLEQIEEIKEEDFGADGNFWNVTTEGLNEAKATIVTAFPELDPVQDAL